MAGRPGFAIKEEVGILAAMAKEKAIQLHIPDEGIVSRIYVIRGKQVMLDRDLAELYGVETRVLKQAVTRNRERFPEDFMFELSKEELAHWRSQFVTSNSPDVMGLRHPPFAFTEQGVAMLSSVLRSKTAIQVNIQIIRTFTRLRHMITNYEQLWHKIEQLESEQVEQNQLIAQVFEALKMLLLQDEKPKKPIGFRAE